MGGTALAFSRMDYQRSMLWWLIDLLFAMAVFTFAYNFLDDWEYHSFGFRIKLQKVSLAIYDIFFCWNVRKDY
jgi:hypothetical protein